MTICETIEAIAETSGTLDKKRILKENLSDTLKLIFEDTYGPQKYYIKSFVPNGDCGHLSLDNDYGTFHCMLVDLVARTVTGDAAYQKLQETVALFDPWSQTILCKIIDRNLKCGISLDNFLDVTGEKETKFEVALAENLNKAKNVDPIDGTYFVSRKLDGVRCICNVSKFGSFTSVTFTSRQGKPITTLGNLVDPIKAFTQQLPDGNWVLDGEVCIIDEDGNESFHGLMKEITRKDHTIKMPKYNVFDCMDREVFNGNREGIRFSNRLHMMNELLASNINVWVIDQERVTSQEILDTWTDRAKKNGWEGCMLRKDAPYKRGRSKDLLKIKGMQDAEYEVVDVLMGKAVYNEGGAKEYDIASALVIKHKGNQVKVGSGLSKEQRLRWFTNPEEIIGKTITVQFFEETKDSKTGEYSLRFPVLKYVYDEGRTL